MISKTTPSNVFLCALIFISMCVVTAPTFGLDNTLFTAKYKGKLAGFTVKTQRELVEISPNHYELTSVAKNVFASITEQSFFHLSSPENAPTSQMGVDKKTAETLFTPEKYFYERRVFGAGSEQKIIFNWADLTAEYTRKDKPEKNTQHKISIGLLDPALYQLKLQNDAYIQKNHFSYVYPDRERIKTMNFAIDGKTSFTLNKKVYDTIVLKRIDKQDNKQTHVTLIPELLYQIAEITHIDEDGDTYSMSLVEFNYNEKKLTEFYRHQK